MRKHKIVFAVLMVLAVLSTGLFAEGQKDDGKLKFAIFIANNSNEFTMSVGNGAVQRGEELGIEVTVFDGKYDQATQINQIETCMVQGYDGLIIEPCTVDGLDPILKQINDAGIPVITVIQEVANQDMVSSFVGADHRAAAAVQMQACVDFIGGKGKIAILEGTPGSDGHIIIKEGFESVLAKYPDVEVVERQNAEWTIDKALSVTETWLQKHNDLVAILGENGPMALGAMKACMDAGIPTGVNGVYINGRDAVTDELIAVMEGNQNATIWQGGPEMGATSVDTILNLINGKPVEKRYMMENILVTQENAEKYLNIRKAMK